jgi:hypothetical protein
MKEELESLAGMAEPGEPGNITRAAEDARAQWGWITPEQIYRDLQYALRAMRRSPAFTATAVLSLALGIGANTAIFSLVDALRLRRLPVRDPQELVQVQMRLGTKNESVRASPMPLCEAWGTKRNLFGRGWLLRGQFQRSFSGLSQPRSRRLGLWRLLRDVGPESDDGAFAYAIR